MPLPPRKFEADQVWDGTTPNSRPDTDVFKHADGEVGNRHSSEIIALEELLHEVVEEIDLINNPGAANSVLTVKPDCSGLLWALVAHANLTGVTADQHHSESHTIVSHDTTATGVQLTNLTDGTNADALHEHNHTALSGLNIDDHIQYGLVDGTRTFDEVRSADGFIKTGWPLLLNITLSFNDGNRTLTVTDGGSAYYYIDGIKYVLGGDKTVTIDNTEGLWYIYFDGGTLTASQTPWLIYDDNKAPVSYLYWDATNGKSFGIGYELHGYTMDAATHSMLHYTIGARWQSGLLTSDAGSEQINVSAGTFYDEDLVIDIADSAGGGAFEQVLSPAELPILYKNGVSDWRLYTTTDKANATDIGYIDVSNNLHYNKLNGTWASTGAGVGKYVAHWIIATNIQDHPVITIMGQRIDTTLLNAKDNNVFSGLDLTGLYFQEISVLARVIVKATASGIYYTIEDIQDLRASASFGNITSPLISEHGGLSGLGDDDHPQYLLADGTRNLTGNLTVDSSITIDGRDISVDGATLDSTKNKVAVDSGATSNYLGAANNDGALRTGTGLNYTDGGNFITIDLNINGLTGESAIVAADTIPFYDATASANRKITFAELGTALGSGVDEKVGVDSGATPGYLGVAFNDGVLRIGTGLDYADGGNFVTLTLSHLGIEALTDPGGDRIMFWDETDEEAVTWLTVSTGLQINGVNLTTKDAEIVHDNLSGFGADNHHAESHNAASHSDIASTGAAIDAAVAASHAESHNAASHSDISSTGAAIDAAVAASHAESHDAASHSDITSNGAEIDAAVAASHAESHNIASHSDTTATGAELETLTDDSMADALHRHSELSASDGTPDPAVSVDADGKVGIGTASPNAKLHLAVPGSQELLHLEAGATDNPYFAFYQTDTRRAWIQFNDTNNNLILASEYGTLSFKAAATAGNDTDTVYLTIEVGGNILIENTLQVIGAITGPNVTSGANPGHTHTGTSLSDINHADLLNVTSDQHHAESHNAASHSDVTSTGAAIDAAVAASHAESHNIASHSDTTATGAELETLTDDSMADALHRHSELSASDGTPNPALSVDADGNIFILNDSQTLAFGAAGITDYGIKWDGNDAVHTITAGQFRFIGGNIELEDTIDANAGCIFKGVTRFIHNFHHPSGGGAIPIGHNVFIGEFAGNFTTGNTATAISHSSNNNGIGYGTLDALTTGYYNVGLGSFSLTDVTIGHGNVGIGHASLAALTTGNDNIAIGRIAGQYIANGSAPNQTTNDSIYIGDNTRASADGADNEIIIGKDAIGQGTNTAIIGGAALTMVYVPSLTSTGTIAGINVTSGADPGHTHTGASLSDINHADLSNVTSDQHHTEAHNIASHSDTTATGAELETLTDNSIANALHRHSELVASDGSPDPALSVDASGAITITPNNHTILIRDSAYGWGAGRISWQAQTAGTGIFLDLHSYDGDGTDDMGMAVWAVGSPTSAANLELVEFRWDESESEFALDTFAAGTGTLRPLNIYTSGNSGQIFLAIDGSVTMAGALGVTGNITGPNVSSGADPGHTHTGASLSGIDISADTNLAVTAPIVLTDDTVSIDQTDIIPSMTNDNAGAITIGQPVYCDGNDGVDLADADNINTSEVIGLVADVSIASSDPGNIRVAGILVATTAQWDAVTGDVGGLTAGTIYYLSDATPGTFTTISPSQAGINFVRVGVGLSTTEMKLLIGTAAPGEAAALPIITTNTTLYIATTGNDTTGDSTSGNPWLTLDKALDWLSNKLIAAAAIVTIQIDDGLYAWTSTDTLDHINGDKINIVGKNTYSLSLTSVQSSSGSSGAWSIVLNVDDVSNAAVGDFLLIPAAVSGGTTLYALPGCWIITNVDAVNTRLTITSTNRHTVAPSGAVSATVILVKTMLQYTGCNGILVAAQGKLGMLNKLVVKGGSAANTGIAVEAKAVCNGGTSLGVWNFANNVSVQSGGHFESDYLTSSNAVTSGLRVYYATARVVSGVFSGCGDKGVSCDTADIILNNILATGNVSYGIWAEAASNLAPVSARVHYNDIGVKADYNSFINAAGAAINSNVSDDASPNVNTEGNVMSYIRN